MARRKLVFTSLVPVRIAGDAVYLTQLANYMLALAVSMEVRPVGDPHIEEAPTGPVRLPAGSRMLRASLWVDDFDVETPVEESQPVEDGPDNLDITTGLAPEPGDVPSQEQAATGQAVSEVRMLRRRLAEVEQERNTLHYALSTAVAQFGGWAEDGVKGLRSRWVNVEEIGRWHTLLDSIARTEDEATQLADTPLLADPGQWIARQIRLQKTPCTEPGHEYLPKPSCWTCGRNGAFERAARIAELVGSGGPASRERVRLARDRCLQFAAARAQAYGVTPDWDGLPFGEAQYQEWLDVIPEFEESRHHLEHPKAQGGTS